MIASNLNKVLSRNLIQLEFFVWVSDPQFWSTVGQEEWIEQGLNWRTIDIFCILQSVI